jgi:hypothetical protein
VTLKIQFRASGPNGRTRRNGGLTRRHNGSGSHTQNLVDPGNRDRRGGATGMNPQEFTAGSYPITVSKSYVMALQRLQ